MTRRLILDVAERICARDGFEGLSVRTVSEQAGVNVAAVNYHFGSKQQLFEEMFRRRVTPLNEERLRQLDDALAGPKAVMLERIVRSFIGPVIRGTGSGHPVIGEASRSDGNPASIVTQFLARVFTVPGEEAFLEQHYEPVRSRFVLALRMCLPALPLDELLWRYNMMVAALIYAMAGPQRMTRLPVVFGERRHATDDSPQASVDRMVAFLVPGFLAPSSAADHGEQASAQAPRAIASLRPNRLVNSKTR